MPDRNAQSTDAQNSASPGKGVRIEDNLRKTSLGSSQAIARDRTNQNTATGSGADPVAANVQAGK